MLGDRKGTPLPCGKNAATKNKTVKPHKKSLTVLFFILMYNLKYLLI